MEGGGADRFPLLRLPENVKLLAVKHMDLLDAFKFSFLSKRALHLLQQRNLRKTGLEVRVSSSILVRGGCCDGAGSFNYEINFQEYDDRKHFLDSNDLSPSYQIQGYGAPLERLPAFKFKRSGYRFEDYFNHCLIVSKTSKIEKLTFKQEVQNLEEFRRIIPKIYYMKICDLFPDNSIQDVLRMFIPNVLHIEREYANIEQHLMNNLDNFITAFPWNLKLENLLTMNARDITMTVHQFSTTDLNRFLKLWIRGANPRLEHLKLRLRNSSKLEMGRTWKGIKYDVAPNAVRREFQYALDRRAITYGGFDIRRMDGTVAIVHTNEHTFFEMFVIAKNI